jgi:hypothetical protein
MRPRKTLSSLTHNDYEKFLRTVQLLAMGLNRSSAELDREGYANLRDEKEGGRVKLTAKYLLDEVGKEYFDATGIFKLVVEDPNTRKAAILVDAEFGAHFHAEAPIVKELAEKFTKSDLRIILWPYFRQHVFDITGRMAIIPITVPIVSGTDE